MKCDGGRRVKVPKSVIIIGIAVAVALTGLVATVLWHRGQAQQAVAAAKATPAAPPLPAVYQPNGSTEPVEPDRPRPEPPPVPVSERRRVPVLMYHEITAGPNALYVAPEELDGHLGWLKEHGYTAITLKRLYKYYTDGAPIPEKAVVLTFDDGYVSYYTNALPLLKKYKWPGTLFVITGSVGKQGMVTWDQVREAAAQGTEIGSHTINHPSLELLTGASLVQEITESRKVLEAETGQRIEFFCYPAGKFNDEVVKTVREAGYLGAVTTQYGLAAPDQDALLWKRIRVNKGLSPQGLGSLIQSATDDK